MAELILEPSAVSQRWNMPAAAGKWEALLSEYLETLARRCDEAGPCVVGHIKALALFPGGGFLRVSVVSPALPAGVEGKTAPGCTELVLALNVIVCGLERHRLERIVCETAASLAAHWKREVITHKHQH